MSVMVSPNPEGKTVTVVFPNGRSLVAKYLEAVPGNFYELLLNYMELSLQIHPNDKAYEEFRRRVQGILPAGIADYEKCYLCTKEHLVHASIAIPRKDVFTRRIREKEEIRFWVGFIPDAGWGTPTINLGDFQFETFVLTTKRSTKFVGLVITSPDTIETMKTCFLEADRLKKARASLRELLETMSAPFFSREETAIAFRMPKGYCVLALLQIRQPEQISSVSNTPRILWLPQPKPLREVL